MVSPTSSMETQLRFIPLAIISALFLINSEDLETKMAYFITIVLSSIVMFHISSIIEKKRSSMLVMANMLEYLAYGTFMIGMHRYFMTEMKMYEKEEKYYAAVSIEGSLMVLSITYVVDECLSYINSKL